MSRDLAQTEEGEVAFAFATKLAKGDFVGAFDLLAPSLQRSTSPIELRERFNSMLSYANGDVRKIDVLDVSNNYPVVLGPDNTCCTGSFAQASDGASVYVAIEGDDFCEAITVFVGRENGRKVIRDIIWGRP